MLYFISGIFLLEVKYIGPRLGLTPIILVIWSFPSQISTKSTLISSPRQKMKFRTFFLVELHPLPEFRNWDGLHSIPPFICYFSSLRPLLV